MTSSTNASEALKRSLEVNANRFNLKCLAVLCGFTVLTAVCNRIGFFTVDPTTMRVAVIVAILGFGSKHLRDRGGRALNYLTQATFPFYLAHQTVLVAAVGVPLL